MAATTAARRAYVPARFVEHFLARQHVPAPQTAQEAAGYSQNRVEHQLDRVRRPDEEV
jgi:hypothetical protein